MSDKQFPERCALAAQCLPDAEYRTRLEILHAEMLHEIGTLRAALAAQQPEQQSSLTGWLLDGSMLYRLTDERRPANRDEIRVTMADGSRSPEACARRAGELFDRIAPPQAPQAVPADVLIDAQRWRKLRDTPATSVAPGPMRGWMFARPGGAASMDAMADALPDAAARPQAEQPTPKEPT